MAAVDFMPIEPSTGEPSAYTSPNPVFFGSRKYSLIRVSVAGKATWVVKKAGMTLIIVTVFDQILAQTPYIGGC